ncbi:glycerol-3-phosphate 1-O-acyltransferase PlsY [Candidatus Magnetomonas plexicatena]|uniref:glycerol-3-phosphate 1-O-acyltransferase PlsY n=1 Tax=Candidatus Magnetomonas plexicatena TaxID=2552947 RepID=UPI001C77F142|nr:glycerol-3-phosphate 1-O-acyltransferase PlsY [Nitrospirales bacterium LBB_01]
MVLYLLLSFLLGSIPFGVVIAKTKGVDLTKVGSCNIGATNVLRSVGKLPALLTFLGDSLKGAVAVLIGKLTGQSDIAIGLMGIFAVLGHDFSIFMKFKGGKGVATSIGTVLFFMPYAGVFVGLTWIITAMITRYSSLSALVAFALLPFASLFIYGQIFDKLNFSLILALLIFYKHRGNIAKLLKGEEPKIGKKTGEKSSSSS